MQTHAHNQVQDLPDHADVFFEPSPPRSALLFLRLLLGARGFKSTVILLYAVFALTVWKYIPPAPRIYPDQMGNTAVAYVKDDAQTLVNFLNSEPPRSYGVVDFIWNARKLWSAFLLMGLAPACVVKFVFRENLSDYGLSLGDGKRTCVCALAFMPIFAVIGWLSGADKAFYAVYPFNPLAGLSYGALIAHSIMYVFLYYLAWEFMFRGFIQHGLFDTAGAPTAICVQVLASTMLHYGHPASETFGCIVGGIFWGFLAVRTRSILAGWSQHAVLGVLLDWSLILKAA